MTLGGAAPCAGGNKEAVAAPATATAASEITILSLLLVKRFRAGIWTRLSAETGRPYAEPMHTRRPARAVSSPSFADRLTSAQPHASSATPATSSVLRLRSLSAIPSALAVIASNALQ